MRGPHWLAHVHAAREVALHAPHHAEREPEEALLRHGHEARSRYPRDEEAHDSRGGALEESLELGGDAIVARELAELEPGIDPEAEEAGGADRAQVEVRLEIGVVGMAHEHHLLEAHRLRP